MEITSGLLIFLLIFTSNALLWIVISAPCRSGGALLVSEPRTWVPWRGSHVAVAFFMYVVLPAMALFIAQMRFGIRPDDEGFSKHLGVITWVLAGDSILKFSVVALVITFLIVDLKTRLQDLGWNAKYWKRDVVTGVVAFFAVAPSVYLLQAVLSLVYEKMTEREAAHPIEEIIRKNATAPVMFWCTVSVVIAAPLVEEFLFRVVLQGWLEKAFHKKHLREQAPDEAPTEVDQPYVPPDRSAPQIMWQPIIISSLVFAFLHVGHGPDPIPLFFLSLALGYLYYKTHRILPCVVVHMALNSLSMVGLWVKLNYGSGG